MSVFAVAEHRRDDVAALSAERAEEVDELVRTFGELADRCAARRAIRESPVRRDDPRRSTRRRGAGPSSCSSAAPASPGSHLPGRNRVKYCPSFGSASNRCAAARERWPRILQTPPCASSEWRSRPGCPHGSRCVIPSSTTIVRTSSAAPRTVTARWSRAPSGSSARWRRPASSALDLPVEYGGRGLGRPYVKVLEEELAPLRHAVDPPADASGMRLAAATLLAAGSEEQKRRYLPPLIRAEEIWCQLFSEPDAGSDLVSLRTRAVRDGDGWVVDGQKVWSSFAADADFGLFLARTDPEAAQAPRWHHDVHPADARSRGDGAAAGRHRRRASLQRGVPRAGRESAPELVLGAVNEGWRVASGTLGGERSGYMGGSGGGRRRRQLTAVATPTWPPTAIRGAAADRRCHRTRADPRVAARPVHRRLARRRQPGGGFDAEAGGRQPRAGRARS